MVMTWPLPAELSKAVCIRGNYLMFILAITEFYSPKTPTPSSYPEYRWLRSPQQKVTMCSGLIWRPILRILLYQCARTVCTRERFVPQQKTKPIFKLGRFHRAIISNFKITTIRDIFESEHVHSSDKIISELTIDSGCKKCFCLSICLF